MHDRNVIYYGTPTPPAERTRLRAGPLTMIFEAGDLRYIRLGNHEIIRRIYVAVRDQNWGTLPAIITNLQMDINDDSFSITFDEENRQNEIDFFWKATITGSTDGTLLYRMDGVARTTFLRNRLGICVLHPAHECAGLPVTVATASGTTEHGSLPQFISPHQPFKDIRAISYPVGDGIQAMIEFEGDIFEMEDQRNWTDASFKTYSTPLSLPIPVEVIGGTTISQAVTLRLKTSTGEPLRPSDIQSSAGTTGQATACIFTVSKDDTLTDLPAIGLGIAGHEQQASPTEIERLKLLHLSHLRLDLQLSRSDYVARLHQASELAQAVGVPLEIALFLSQDGEQELASLLRVLADLKPPVKQWLIFNEQEAVTDERWIVLARNYLQQYNPAAKIGGGTNLYFTHLNRNRPSLQAIDFVSYSINPQVHAFDNGSLIETLETQAATIASARQFSGKLPVSLSPVTLKPRFNPDASTAATPVPAGTLPPEVDLRQMSLLGAVWTLGSLKYLAESGVMSVTYYETSGWRGVMESETGSPLPEIFRSEAGNVYPLYHVLADLGEFAGGQACRSESGDTLTCNGLVLKKDGRTRILLANMTNEPQQIRLSGLDEQVNLRYLDERNIAQATSAPEAFRNRPGETVTTESGNLSLQLLPYAIARLDSL